jgi:type I restriction enzyme M protein
MDVSLATAVVQVWQELGDPFDTPPKSKPGALAKSLDLTPARARALLDPLAVPDPDAEPVTDTKGNALPDPDLRDNENVPLPAVPVTYEADPVARLQTVEYRTAIDDYLAAEVHPYVPDAWVDHTKTKFGYEVPLTRHFYTYVPPRPLDEIDAEIKQLEAEIQDLLREVTE